MITPRTTRLVRVADLQALRDAVVALACAGDPQEARHRLVVVPTRAAAAHLLRTIENRIVETQGAAVLPDLITAGELVPRLAERVALDARVLSDADREVLLGVACREAQQHGTAPPFRLRPGLTAEMLRLYDALRRHQKDVGTFERLALGMLEPGAAYDRGAERLVRQTRFLVAAFREFERRCGQEGLDEHTLRARLMSVAAARPFRDIILTVGDAAFETHGLSPADWDLLARLPGLERLDLVVTETMLAGALHERIHRMLPGIEEVRVGAAEPGRRPLLIVPPGGMRVHAARDREEEVAGFARRIKQAERRGEVQGLDRVALVVRQPLPYVYIAREVLRSGGVPCQMFDALPLAAEPYAAALDVLFSAVSAAFARGPAIELLRSPHFRFEPGPAAGARGADAGHGSDAASAATPLAGGAVTAHEIAALDRALSDAGYLGEVDALERLIDAWRATVPQRRSLTRALRAGMTLLGITRELEPLRSPAAVGDHLHRLVTFLTRHDGVPPQEDPLQARELRARSAILATLSALRDAYRRFDRSPVAFDEVAALTRRWIEAQTFAPRTGEAGVHLVDADAARFGDFDEVQLAGLVEGEWPDRPCRNIFYSPAILRELGWPAESDRLDGLRASFRDLLRLPAARLALSTFTLEADALASPSPLIDELDEAALEPVEAPQPSARIFEYEALGVDPVDAQALCPAAREWAGLRATWPSADGPRFRGSTAAHESRAWSVSALERYQDCPFRFFAADVLRLEEAPDDEATLTPRARGRFVHEVFQRFFAQWDARAQGTITVDRLDEARALFIECAAPLLGRLPEAESALERARLFGSAINVGMVDTVLGLEAARSGEVRERLLEYRLEGEFSFSDTAGASVPLRGVADRIDLLSGNRLRVIDYKSGSAPNVKRALQVPVYALCAQQRLSERDGVPWQIEEAAYIAFSGKRALVPVVRAGAPDAGDVLAAARTRLIDVLAGIGAGTFPPRPHDPMICGYCAYVSVCRKDYVGDE